MMRGGDLHALSTILGHKPVSMTGKYAHLAPAHLRAEMARTEQRARGPARDEGAAEVVDFTSERRGSSEAEQLIRNQ